MTLSLNMNRDVAGNTTYGLIQSDTKYGVGLVQNVEQNFTVPGAHARYLAIFTYEPGTAVFISINDTAAAFTGVLGSVVAELNPVAREVKADATISMLTTNATAYVGVALYAI